MSKNLQLHDVGFLDTFAHLADDEVIPTLLKAPFFRTNTPTAFVDLLKENLHVIISRLDDALRANNVSEASWINLCNQPLARIRAEWTTAGRIQLPEPTANQQVHKKSMVLYYCVYAIMLWRHHLGHRRYQRAATTKAAFKARYTADRSFQTQNMGEHGRRIDSWEKLFHFRNALVLASAVNPGKRNKCLFVQVASLLSEGRVHTLGGGQSYTAHRRCYLYPLESIHFATPSYVIFDVFPNRFELALDGAGDQDTDAGDDLLTAAPNFQNDQETANFLVEAGFMHGPEKADHNGALKQLVDINGAGSVDSYFEEQLKVLFAD